MFSSWLEIVERSYFVDSFSVSKAIIVINEMSDIFARIPPTHKSIFSWQHFLSPLPGLMESYSPWKL